MEKDLHLAHFRSLKHENQQLKTSRP